MDIVKTDKKFDLIDDSGKKILENTDLGYCIAYLDETSHIKLSVGKSLQVNDNED